MKKIVAVVLIALFSIVSIVGNKTNVLAEPLAEESDTQSDLEDAKKELAFSLTSFRTQRIDARTPVEKQYTKTYPWILVDDSYRNITVSQGDTATIRFYRSTGSLEWTSAWGWGVYNQETDEQVYQGTPSMYTSNGYSYAYWDTTGMAPGKYMVLIITLYYSSSSGWQGVSDSGNADYAIVTVKAKEATPPDVTSATYANKKVTIKYSSTSGASKYEIQRKTGSGSWTTLGTATGTSYTDSKAQAGNKYTYRVRAYANNAWTAFGATKSVTTNPFIDVSEDDGYYTPIMWAYNNGIASGTSEDMFSPKMTCTRGQFVTMLYRYAGSPDVSNVTNPFKDVKESDGYYKPIMWAYKNKIVNGTSSTTFSPKDECTRGQIATMLYKYAGKPSVTGITNPFTDVKSSDGYYKAIMWAVKNGITKGTSETTFSPKNPCTRGQLVTFLYRFDKLK